MGLAEKRALKEVQDKLVPPLTKEIAEAAKFPVPLEIQWDTIAPACERYAEIVAETIPLVYFKPVIEAFKKICADDMGRDALKGALKKVVFRHGGWPSFTFEDGVLTIDHDPVTNRDDWDKRRDKIAGILEKAL